MTSLATCTSIMKRSTKLDAALTALSVTVPALLRELDRLDGMPDEKD